MRSKEPITGKIPLGSRVIGYSKTKKRTNFSGVVKECFADEVHVLRDDRVSGGGVRHDDTIQTWICEKTDFTWDDDCGGLLYWELPSKITNWKQELYGTNTDSEADL